MALHEALGIFDGATCFFAGFDESPEQSCDRRGTAWFWGQQRGCDLRLFQFQQDLAFRTA
jgi:hypothetical protein